MSRFAFVLIAVALVASSCARSETLGPAEAVEVMVLDGVDRDRAICIVNALDGDLDLAKVTGLDVELDAGELSSLSNTSAACAPAVGFSGGILGGATIFDEPSAAAEVVAAALAERIETRVYGLIEDGLAPTVGTCLLTAVTGLDEPQDALDDVFFLSSLIVDCGESIESEKPVVPGS